MYIVKDIIYVLMEGNFKCKINVYLNIGIMY